MTKESNLTDMGLDDLAGSMEFKLLVDGMAAMFYMGANNLNGVDQSDVESSIGLFVDKVGKMLGIQGVHFDPERAFYGSEEKEEGEKC